MSNNKYVIFEVIRSLQFSFAVIVRVIMYVTAIECPQIHWPVHGSRDGDQTEYPAQVMFTCFPGYEMQGIANISCQANGQWSHAVPTCTGKRHYLTHVDVHNFIINGSCKIA